MTNEYIIDSEKINNFYLDRESNETILDKILSEINTVDNCNILVTGYRGAGKTTLVNSLIQKYQDKDKEKKKNLIFVNCRVDKYDSYTNLLRQIFRNIYWVLNKPENRELKKQLSGEELDETSIYDLIEELYRKTFYNIDNISDHQIYLESSYKAESKLSASNLITLIQTSSFAMTIGTMVNKHIWASIFFLLIQFILIPIRLHISKKLTNSSLISQKVTELYDDDIAETKLLQLVELLNNRNFRLVLVFDEVDKIMEVDALYKFYSDIKFLLLSKYVSNIVLAGQKTYEQLERTSYENDSLLNSLFTSNHHVSIASKEEFHSLVEQLVDEPDIAKNEDFNHFIDYLILESNMILRNFINLFLSKISRKEEKLVLIINDSEKYKKSTEVVDIIFENIDTYNNIDIILKDKLVYHQVLWINKIKKLGAVSILNDEFYTADILIEQNNIDLMSPIESIVIKNLASKFLSSLAKKKIIELKDISPEEILAVDQVEFKINIQDSTVNVEELYKMKFEQIIQFLHGDLQRDMKNLGKNIEGDTLNDFKSIEGSMGRIVQLFEKYILHKFKLRDVNLTASSSATAYDFEFENIGINVKYYSNPNSFSMRAVHNQIISLITRSSKKIVLVVFSGDDDIYSRAMSVQRQIKQEFELGKDKFEIITIVPPNFETLNNFIEDIKR